MHYIVISLFVILCTHENDYIPQHQTLNLVLQWEMINDGWYTVFAAPAVIFVFDPLTEAAEKIREMKFNTFGNLFVIVGHAI